MWLFPFDFLLYQTQSLIIFILRKKKFKEHRCSVDCGCWNFCHFLPIKIINDNTHYHSLSNIKFNKEKLKPKSAENQIPILLFKRTITTRAFGNESGEIVWEVVGDL